MIIRKLEQSEHIATRKLWEEIFPEDTKAFLDYYYYIKAAKNPLFCEVLPLTLEEIFISETEVAGYEVKNLFQ